MAPQEAPAVSLDGLESLKDLISGEVLARLQRLGAGQVEDLNEWGPIAAGRLTRAYVSGDPDRIERARAFSLLVFQHQEHVADAAAVAVLDQIGGAVEFVVSMFTNAGSTIAATFVIELLKRAGLGAAPGLDPPQPGAPGIKLT
jgi:aryl-alcohol dehydrogenase-like predicted oxidoreductase